MRLPVAAKPEGAEQQTEAAQKILVDSKEKMSRMRLPTMTGK